jgi:hypothetical protein
MNAEYFKTLVHAYLDGALSPIQKVELEDALRESAACRLEFWKQTEIHGRLRSAAENEALWQEIDQVPEKPVALRRGKSWLRNPIVAAAAGFALSLVCTSTVRAYMSQWGSKVRQLPLVNGGFETRSEVGAGSPLQIGVWSGDYSRMTGPENGVTPFRGSGMLRFERADSAVSEPGARHNIGEILQIIDLRAFQKELAGGKGQVEISARFASGVEGPGYYFSLRAVSFKGPIQLAAEAWRDRAVCGRTSAERRVEASHSASGPVWQKIQLNLPILPDTDFLILQGAATRLPKPEAGAVEFPAHYMDEVTALLRVNHQEGES